ncbi:MAG: DUF4125 family protein [Syntrophobacteraceae bacterium]
MASEKHAGKDVIEKILAIEIEMFLKVSSANSNTCQQYPESFKIHRRAQFSPWSLPTLESYLRDLENAKSAGINLMTQKYARMDNLIAPLNGNPLIDVITASYCAWQRAMKEKYPGILSKGRPLSSAEDSVSMTSFETYARGELETYSDATLALLHKDIQDKLAHGVSLTEEVYECLVRQLSYSSIEDAEKKVSGKK